MNNEINVRGLWTGVYDERANDKGAIRHESANASGSILYLYEPMNAWDANLVFSGAQGSWFFV